MRAQRLATSALPPSFGAGGFHRCPQPDEHPHQSFAEHDSLRASAPTSRRLVICVSGPPSPRQTPLCEAMSSVALRTDGMSPITSWAIDCEGERFVAAGGSHALVDLRLRWLQSNWRAIAAFRVPIPSSLEPHSDGRSLHWEELLPSQALVFRIPRRDSGFQECGEHSEA